jgi:drug/metabolite transporter (DMT)-like permease
VRRGESQGMLLGLAGVVIFSLTLPMTRVAVRDFDPVLVGLGRALLAAVLAALLLSFTRQRAPSRAQVNGLLLVSLGVIAGFPVFSSIAMRTLPSAHGAVVVGLLPFATALAAAWRADERPSPLFWLCATLGSALVIGFALREGGGTLQWGDAAMLLAVGLGALGYAEGGKLARDLGGWQVICWALVLSVPWLVPAVGWLAWHQDKAIGLPAWGAFVYVAVFSQFLGFFAWYRGLALGGVARVGQVQLLQIFFTIGFAALMFGEVVEPVTWMFAIAVAAVIAIGRRAKVSRPVPKGA